MLGNADVVKDGHIAPKAYVLKRPPDVKVCDFVRAKTVQLLSVKNYASL